MQVSPAHSSKKTLHYTHKTLRGEASFSGIGVHTGVDVSLTFRPASAGVGIVFRRIDLPGKPEIPALLSYVQDTNRCTTIGRGKVQVTTIEHVMAALSAYGITNLYVDVSAEEPPVGDGSSRMFVSMIEEVGILEQEELSPLSVTSPVYWSEGDMHLVALPADHFRVSYTLSYPQSNLLKGQYQSFFITKEIFRDELSCCRTFSLYEEISPLLDRGLIKGGSLSNSIVIKDDAVISNNGLHFPDEMVRHKILDLIGDVSLIGSPLHAHIIAIRSGHRANYEFAKELQKHLIRE